jgi:hypothetical protein
MSISGNGLVGIGVTNPQQLLALGTSTDQVGAGVSGVVSTVFFGTPTNLAGGMRRISYDRAAGNLSFIDGSIASPTTQMTMTAAGNVGIGTVSPTFRLVAANNTFDGVGMGSSSTYSFLNIGGYFSGTAGAAQIGFERSTGAFVFGNGTRDTPTERMRITAAGFVGVGTGAPGSQFENVGQTRLGANVAVAAPSSTDILSTSHTAMGGNGGNYLTIGQYPGAQGFAQWIQSSFSNPTLALYNLILQPLGGNVGIGTATPGVKLEVVDNKAGNSYFDYYNTTNGGNLIWRQIVRNIANTGVTTVDFAKLTGGAFFINNNDTDAANFTAFGVAGAERMRITSSGNLLVGTTSSTGGIAGTAPRLVVEPPNTSTHGVILKSLGQSYDVGLIWNTGTSGDNKFFEFGTDATYTARGSINYNRTAGLVAYNTTSDYRAKTIHGDVGDVGEVIDAFKIYDGTMNGAELNRPMLIAHEAQAIAPYAVVGEKDAVNEDGTDKYQQIDHSTLIPLLIAEIQSLRARVAQLEGN